MRKLSTLDLGFFICETEASPKHVAGLMICKRPAKSTAAFALLRMMKFPYPLLQIFRIIPICQRDRIYDYVAKRRHRIMSGFCVMPTIEQKKRFLVG